MRRAASADHRTISEQRWGLGLGALCWAGGGGGNSGADVVAANLMGPVRSCAVGVAGGADHSPGSSRWAGWSSPVSIRSTLRDAVAAESFEDLVGSFVPAERLQILVAPPRQRKGTTLLRCPTDRRSGNVRTARSGPFSACVGHVRERRTNGSFAGHGPGHDVNHHVDHDVTKHVAAAASSLDRHAPVRNVRQRAFVRRQRRRGECVPLDRVSGADVRY